MKASKESVAAVRAECHRVEDQRVAVPMTNLARRRAGSSMDLLEENANDCMGYPQYICK